MPQSSAVKSTDFSRQFARYTSEAIARGVIEVENHNRLVGAFLSPAEYRHYQRLKLRERQVALVSELPEAYKTMRLDVKYGE